MVAKRPSHFVSHDYATLAPLTGGGPGPLPIHRLYSCGLARTTQRQSVTQ